MIKIIIFAFIPQLISISFHYFICKDFTVLASMKFDTLNGKMNLRKTG